jgi:hypothetical protein
MRGVPGRKVSILGGHSVGYSKQYLCVCTFVLFPAVSEVELTRYTVPELLIRKINYIRFLMSVFIFQVTNLLQFT